MSSGVRTTPADGRSKPGPGAVDSAAAKHFLADGYGATTIAAIAADVGVSVEAIYKAFKNKPGLLKAVFDVAIAGDDEPVPLMDREFVGAINVQPDPSEKLRMYARHLARAMARTARIQLLVRGSWSIPTSPRSTTSCNANASPV